MRTNLPPFSQSASRQVAQARDRAQNRVGTAPLFNCTIRVSLLAAGVALIAAASQLNSQEPAAQPAAPASTPAQRFVHSRKRSSPAHSSVSTVPVAPEPVAQPVPEPPKWPAFDHAVQASIVWDSQGLSIEADNSSLQQILKDVSTATGAKVEGLSSDERVFGAYGPGKARDVLSQLLQGSGYNVIMVGDEAGGVPRQIQLSPRLAANAAPAARSVPNSSSEEEEPEEQSAPEEPTPIRPGFQPGAPPRSPQQILQEMQQRQQRMQQQQPNPQQPINPQN